MTTDRKLTSPEGSGPVRPELPLAAGVQPPSVPSPVTTTAPSGLRRAKVLTTEVDENKRGEAEVVIGAIKGPGGWLYSPANFELMVLGDKRLIKVARALGAAVNRVDKVRAARPKNTKLVFITPTDDEDPDGIPVIKKGAHAWINLVELLTPLKLTVPMGQKQYFRVDFAGAAIAGATYEGTPCPYEAAIVFNMEKVVETAVVPKKERKKKGTQEQPNGTGNTNNGTGNTNNGAGNTNNGAGNQQKGDGTGSATNQPAAQTGGQGAGAGAKAEAGAEAEGSSRTNHSASEPTI
jgi:hypothetical protein